MKQAIVLVALVVRDYDEAIDFYVNTLGFSLLTALVEQQLSGSLELNRDKGTHWIIKFRLKPL